MTDYTERDFTERNFTHRDHPSALLFVVISHLRQSVLDATFVPSIPSQGFRSRLHHKHQNSTQSHHNLFRVFTRDFVYPDKMKVLSLSSLEQKRKSLCVVQFFFFSGKNYRFFLIYWRCRCKVMMKDSSPTSVSPSSSFFPLKPSLRVIMS